MMECEIWVTREAGERVINYNGMRSGNKLGGTVWDDLFHNLFRTIIYLGMFSVCSVGNRHILGVNGEKDLMYFLFSEAFFLFQAFLLFYLETI